MLRKRSEPTAEQNAVKSIFSPTSPVQNLKTYDPQLQNTSSAPTVPTPPPNSVLCDAGEDVSHWGAGCGIPTLVE